jgi:hypothetical protein
MEQNNSLLAAGSTTTATPSARPTGTGTAVEAREQLASILYPAAPPKTVDTAPNAEVAALRAADPARGMYRPEDQFGPNGGALRDLALAVNPTASADALQRQRVALGAVMTDIGMDRGDVSKLASFAAAYAAKPPTAEEKAAHERASIKTLREQYGDAAFAGVLADAKALVARDPRLREFMDKTGLGSHPWAISRLAELARTERGRGRLK